MAKRRIAVPVLLPFVLLAGANWGFCSDKDKATSAEELVSRARALEVWSEGSHGTSIKGELEVADSKNGIVRGDYGLIWESPRHWAETIHFSNYDRERVRDGDTIWIKSSVDFQPVFVFQLDILLDSRRALTLAPTEKAKRVWKRKDGGIEEQCTEVYGPGSTERNLCFDARSGTLVRIEYPKEGSVFEISRIEQADFRELGGKLIPTESHAFRGKQAILGVKIISTEEIGGNPPSLKPAPGARPWPTCENVTPGELKERTVPEYSRMARDRREQGKVTLYAVIDTDGSLRNLHVIETAGADLDASAIEAVRHWRYRPAMCGDTPIPAETAISVIFRLAQ